MNMKNSGSKGYNFGLIGLAIAFAGLLIALIVFLVKRNREKKKLEVSTPSGQITEREANSTIEEQKETFREIYQAAKALGYNDQVSLAIAGQSAHETGRWKSDLATKYFNIFGMKSGGGGQNIQSGEVKGFATYTDYENSLRDLDAWLMAKGFNKGEDLGIENYLQWIKSKKYFEDTLQNYKTSVLSLINELSK